MMAMQWFVFSLLSAFCQSIIAIFGKRGTQKIDPLLMAWSQYIFSLLILFPLCMLTHSMQPVNTTFLTALVISSILYSYTSILFFKAMKESPISLTLPILSFVPIFALITSPIILGEFPSVFGVFGIVITVVGSYILNLSKRVDGAWQPLLSLVKDKGSRMMLIIAFTWSISSNFDRMAIVNANSFIYAFASACMTSILLTCVILIKRVSFQPVFKKIHILVPIGIFTGLSMLSYSLAYSLTMVPHVTAVKRTSALFGILWGKLLFKEDNIKERFFGAAIMVIGVVIIVLG